MKLIDFFRERMQACGMSARMLAESIGIDPSYIHAVMGEKRRIGDKTFTRMCIALDLDEDAVRREYGDQIAPRGHKEYRKKDDDAAKAKKRTRSRKENRLTELEKEDPAELLINFMHLFVCELNDDGKRVTMAMMKMLTGIEAFSMTKKTEETHENTDHEIQA